MTKSKNTKRALLASILSLLLCMAMLIGSTFAWFTDSVTSGNNKIVAGNLDINLQYTTDGSTWEDVGEATNLFKTDTLWEPGHMEVAYLKIENLGTLALKYQLSINAVDTVTSTSVQGNEIRLSEYLEYAVVDLTATDDTVAIYDRAGAEAALAGAAKQALSVAYTNGADGEVMLPKTDASAQKYIALIVYMPESVGNEANYDKAAGYAAPQVDLGISLIATQTPYESDSFDENYDQNAWKNASTLEELAQQIADANDNDVILLSGDIRDTATLTINKDITLVLGGHALAIGEVQLNSSTLTLRSGRTEGLTVSGVGTLILDMINAVGSEEKPDAISLDENADINMVIQGSCTVKGAKNGNGIKVPETASLDLTGDTLTVTGNNGQEYSAAAAVYQNGSEDYDGTGGSGIGNAGAAVGSIKVHDMKSLTALGYGAHAFGIGGNVSAEISISNTVISRVRGGFASSSINAGNYGKNEPEGGCAIGVGASAESGKVILANVMIQKAEGGSKAAAIGAEYWAAVEIEIDGCTLDNIVGGNGSAAIGGGRHQQYSTTQTVTITIKDSAITAQGGEHGAGIGSGYDVNCNEVKKSSMCTINISGDSKIAAVGGKYAAGIGTGYHNGLLSGTIEASVDTTGTMAGEKVYKDKYTTAQDIGFGVIDPSREGLNNTSSITVGDQVITIPSVSSGD